MKGMFILIADDEKMIRLSLQSMLEELYPDEHMYLHASNGQAAVKQIEKLPPDLVFLDIRMPLMSGLEVLETCRAKAPSTHWVFLSGYADFEYAQKAVSLSAYSYLLKPVDLETLKKVVDEIAELKRQETVQNNKLFTLDIIRSFHMADQLGTNEVGLLAYGKGYYVIFEIYIDEQEKGKQHILKQELFRNLDLFCSENISVIYHAVFFDTDGELCVVCSVKDPSHLIFYMNSQIGKYSDAAISVFMGAADSLEEIYRLGQEISSLAELRLIYDCRSAVDIQKMKKLPELEGKLYFCGNINNFVRSALVESRERVHQLAASLEHDLRMIRAWESVDHEIMYQYLGRQMSHFFCADNFLKFMNELYEAAAELFCMEPLKNFDVKAIRDFVHQNYAKDVSISYVSEFFNLSPTYFSKLFHERTGQKYIDFVTEVRMENAKRLIQRQPEITVKETAEAVGYTSVRHFSKTFQKYTGVLPSNFLN